MCTSPVEGSSRQIIGGADNSWIHSAEGKGTGLLGRIISVANTIIDFISGINFKSDVMGNWGRQLNDEAVTNYLKKLGNQREDFAYDTTFMSDSFYGDNVDMEDSVVRHVDGTMSKGELGLKSIFKNFCNSKQTKFAIPLVLPPTSSLEEKHIVMIFVDKDSNTLEYFDSKGITSENRLLESGKKMSVILSELAAVYNGSKNKKSPQQTDVEVLDNAKVVQLDVHNCGAYVSWFATERLGKSGEKGKSAQAIIKDGIDSQGILNFRAGMKMKKHKVS